jgi:hypothetical protein
MAYVVRLILVAPILLSICVLGLHFYPLKVRYSSKAARRHPITQCTMAGVLMLLTAYKLFSYRNEKMNQA